MNAAMMGANSRARSTRKIVALGRSIVHVSRLDSAKVEGSRVYRHF